MAVEEDVRALLLGVVPDDHGAAGGRPNRGVEAELAQLGREPFGGALAFFRIGRIGRDGGDADQLEQPLEARLDVLVGMHFVQA